MTRLRVSGLLQRPTSTKAQDSAVSRSRWDHKVSLDGVVTTQTIAALTERPKSDVAY